MAESTGSRLTNDDDFWKLNRNDCNSSDNNFGGVSVWCNRCNITRLIDEVRMGDRLEFINSNLPCAHWGIYVGKCDILPSVVQFIHGNEEGRAYSHNMTYFHDSLQVSDDVLVINSIFKCVILPGGKVRINNSKDKEWPPVGTGHICKEISYQLRELHRTCVLEKIYACRVSFKDSEDFVNYCRYDRDHQHYMNLLNNKKVSEWYSKANIEGFIREVCVGDRLEFRCNSPCERWGMYIGQWEDNLEQVVIFAPVDENDETISAMISSGIGSSTRHTPELCVKSIVTVLGDDQVRINNERDLKWLPNDKRNILEEISRQLPGRTRRNTCNISFKASKDFVNYCRYDSWRINFGLVSDWYNSWWSLPRLRVGDRLEFNRSNRSYEHWGIYVGQWGYDLEQVVHFDPAKENRLFVSFIWELLGTDKVRINNKRDETWPPLIWTDIVDEISVQLPGPTHRYARTVLFNDSEDFVNYCRYDYWRINFGLVGDWCDSLGSLPRMRLGDRLEFRRTASPFVHWGIYVGDWEDCQHQVVHFTPANENGEISKKDSSGSWSSTKDKPVPCVDHIMDVLGNDQFRINNERDETWQPLIWTDILDKIKRQLPGQTHRYAYKDSFKDSENFVNHCRYDYGRIDFGLVGEWCDSSGSLPRMRLGDRLEFRHALPPYFPWGIYVGEWGDDHHQVAYFAPAKGNGKISKKESSGVGSSAKVKPVLCVNHIVEILGNDQFRINNERDEIWPPLDTTDILDEIRRLIPDKTRRHACKVLFNDSEDFVNYCRYDYWRINFRKVSDWCRSWLSLPRLHAGDRLEFYRTALPYAHWGIYVGDWEGDHHQVVHFALANGNGKNFSKKKSSGKEFLAKDKPVLCVNSIWEILGDQAVRINNKRDLTWHPFVRADILNEIKSQLESQSTGHTQEYHIFSNNCEHFVNHFRYRKRRSDQIDPFSGIHYRIVKALKLRD